MSLGRNAWQVVLKNKIYLVFIILVASLSAKAELPFESVVCPNTNQLAKELLDSELSGQRFYAAKAECRDIQKFPHFRSASYTYGERPGALPWYQADLKIPYVIKKVTESPGKLITVQFEWHVIDKQNPTKIKIIPDVMKFAVYAGKTKAVVGCTGVLFAPANIVVRQSCINSSKLKK